MPMKRWIATAMMTVSLGSVADEVDRVVSEISPDRLERTIKRLAAFGTRHTLSDTTSETRGIGAARRWIKSELEACGRGTPLQVAFDEHDVGPSARVPAPGAHVVNVVATLPGSQPESRERVYVVSGHYDSLRSDFLDPVGDAPGADDDASGTAVSMELACVMSHHKFDATLVFMAVAGEEQGLLGSTAFAKAARARGMDVAGMLDNDIVGSPRGADGTRQENRLRLFAQGVPATETVSPEVRTALGTGGENDLPTRQLARAVKVAADRHVQGFHVDVIWRADRYLRGGDHFPFLEAGYPAVRFTESVEDWRHQHQSPRVEGGVQYGDLPEFVDYAYVANVARVNAAALASLALAPAAPADVEMEALRLEADTTLRWKPNPEPDLAGYRIVWRDTTAAEWQHARDVGNVTRYTLQGIPKDDFTFGVQAVDRDGNVSVASYPKPTRVAK
jgi:peptidase M28-like protein